MNTTDPRFADFALVREMLEAPDLIAGYDFNTAATLAAAVKRRGRLFLTGEGSSRIFPAKSFMVDVLQRGLPIAVATDGSIQAMEYDLAEWVVFGASNSGQTKELILLFDRLKEQGHADRYGVTANAGTKLQALAQQTFVLTCGKEKAVAATKSVVEQALFYRSVLAGLTDKGEGATCVAGQQRAGELAREILLASLDERWVECVAAAPTLYFAGRNNGVAEELTLKGNEITRKKCDFLEGTYILHGIEEVMTPEEVVVLVEPYPSECAAIHRNLVEKIGVTVLAISARETPFPTIRVPSSEGSGFDCFFQLFAGWNLLVHAGTALGIDLDKPQRARKIGNACDD